MIGLLNGRTVLVTGGAGFGIGSGVCQAVVEAGGLLVVNDVHEQAAKAIAKQYPGTIVLPGDISDEATVSRMFEMAEHDGIEIDGLVNNAGIGLSTSAHEAAAEEVDRLIAVDWRGLWLVARAFARHVMARGGWGSIVNVSSVHAIATFRRYALYSGVKAAVEGFTRGLAVELGPHGIRCNAIAPGYVHSEQNLALIATWSDDPQGWVAAHTAEQQVLDREIEPIDCGRAATFLLSDAGRCITGQVLRVDAGTTALLYNRSFT